MDLNALIEQAEQMKVAVSQAKRSLARLNAVDAHAKAALAKLTADDEGLRRLVGASPDAATKILNDLKAERKQPRAIAAGVALHQLRGADALWRATHDFAADARRDTARTWVNEYDNHSARDMYSLFILEEMVSANRRPALEAATSTVRLLEYKRVLADRSDPRSRIIGALIETIADAGTGATTPDELPASQLLRELIEATRAARVPAEVASVAEAALLAKKTGVQLERAGVQPINGQHNPQAGAIAAAELANTEE